MANTVIALKKSSIPSSTPSDLANGELAINFADGKLFYKNTAGYIAEISGSGGDGGNSFGTVNADGTLIVSDTAGDILTLMAGDNITITGDAINDKITISGSNVISSAAFDKANLSNIIADLSFNTANAAFDKANTGGGSAFYSGNNGDVGDATGLGDIFRVHTKTVSQNVTIYSGNNALCVGPIVIAPGKTLVVQSDARVSVV